MRKRHIRRSLVSMIGIMALMLMAFTSWTSPFAMGSELQHQGMRCETCAEGSALLIHLEETIPEPPTPTAAPERQCRIHWVLIGGIIFTLVYFGIAVIKRRQHGDRIIDQVDRALDKKI